MTTEDLNRSLVLGDEAIALHNELKRRKRRSLTGTRDFTRPAGNGNKDQTGEQVVSVEQLTEMLQNTLVNYYKSLVELEEFIETVPDSFERIILRMKYMDGSTWTDIGKTMNRSRRTVQRHYKKWMERMGVDD